MLIDTPYSYDGVSTGREKSVKCWVQLQGIDPISVVLLHFISNNIGNLTNTSRLAVYEVIKHVIIKSSLLVANLKFKFEYKT